MTRKRLASHKFSLGLIARSLLVLSLALLVGLAAKAEVWASSSSTGQAQTIPTVTPAAQPGTPVSLPNGLDTPQPGIVNPDSNLFWLQAFPFGCLFLVGALLVCLIGLAVWRFRRRRKVSN